MNQVSLVKPGLIGRLGRLVVGLLQLQFVAVVLQNFAWVVSEAAFSDLSGLWLGVLLAFWFLPEAVNLGFSLLWGRWPQGIFLLVAFVLGLYDLFQGGAFWGTPLAFWVAGISVYVHAHMGFSHVLSALLATPGCEMRAIPHLYALTTHSAVESVLCPGPWDRLDHWERRGKAS